MVFSHGNQSLMNFYLLNFLDEHYEEDSKDIGDNPHSSRHRTLKNRQ